MTHRYEGGNGFDTTGARVPTLVISPRVKKNTVFRSDDQYMPYHSTSLAATVLSWFGIPRESWCMGMRVTFSPTFEGVFQLSEPRTDLPTLVRATDKSYPTTDPIPVAAPAPVDSPWQDTEKTGLWTYYKNWLDTSQKNLAVTAFGDPWLWGDKIKDIV